MTYARSHLIDPNNDGTYHLYTRCVRRAWLCGLDPETGKSFEHRKQWLEQRILDVSRAFAVSLYSYAIMSNHYHIVIRSHPSAPDTWSDEEVAERWMNASFSNNDERKARQKTELLESPERLKEIRTRLGSVSWYMRYINEPLARMANREDGCTGRFTEARFKSSALLDTSALLSCMVYVDLNPVRSGVTDKPTESPHTSIRRRCGRPLRPSPLAPLWTLNLRLDQYVSLVEWTAETSGRVPGSVSLQEPPPLCIEDMACWSEWHSRVVANRERYRAYGAPEKLSDYAASQGQRWMRGNKHPPPAKQPLAGPQFP